MLSSKIQQIITIPHKQPINNQIVIGICDYIPFSLKQQNSLSINIDADYLVAVNSILWNEFFTKTLLRQCQHHLVLQSYNEGYDKKQPLFMKCLGKFYKLDECLEWNCELRRTLEKPKQTKGEIVIEGFTRTGRAKQIAITFGQYSRKNTEDLVLRIVPQLSAQSEIQSSITQRQEVQPLPLSQHFEETLAKKPALPTHKLQIESQPLKSSNLNTSRSKASKRYSTNANKSKKPKESAISKSKTKNSKPQNKQNKNIEIFQTTKKSNSKLLCNSQNTYELPSSRIMPEQSKPQIFSNFHNPVQQINQKHSYNRQAVLSKILKGKQELIISLKEEIQKQEMCFLQQLEEQRTQKKQQTLAISQNIKSVLQDYQTRQKEMLNQNNYHKERVKVLEETLVQRQLSTANFISEKESLMKVNREQQEIIKQLNSSHKALDKQSQSEITKLKEQNQYRMKELKQWMEKCHLYQQKYEQLVAVMKKSLPSDE